MKSSLLTLFLILLVAIPSKAQETQKAVEFVQLFKSLQNDLPRESIYLHTDRDWYYLSERIWFSAYVVSGSYNIPSGISKVLYVELIKPNGRLAERISIELTNGRGSGSITFEKGGKKPGKFRIKAYTAWATNFGESYIFSKDIDVLNKNGLTLPEESTEVIDIQFLPESGHLIDGVTTRLAFKAIGADGLGKNVSGVIQSTSGNETIAFSSEHRGMGSVDFTPQKGADYFAMINSQRYSLPEVASAGVGMRVNNFDEQYEIQIQPKGAYSSQTMLFFAQVRGEVYAASIIHGKEGKETLNILKKDIPTGIVHFTLLNNEGYPIAERLSFNKNEVDEVETFLSLDNQIVNQRDRTGLNLQVVDKEGNPVASTASVTVFDDTIQPYNRFSTDIQSRFYLETELKGYVEEPGFYFSNVDNADKYLELLLLTQGWRAYDMQQIAELEELELSATPEQGFSISGAVVKGASRTPQRDAPVFYAADGNVNKVVTTDEKGRFVISDLHLVGEEAITLRSNSSNGNSNVSFKIDDQYDHSYFRQKNVIPQVQNRDEKIQDEETDLEEILKKESDRAESASEDAEQFVESQMQLELEEITVSATSLEEEVELGKLDYITEATRTPMGRASTLDFEKRTYLQVQRFISSLDMVPGVHVDYRTRFVSVDTGVRSINGGSGGTLILIDGVRATSQDLFFMNSSDVKNVKVLRSSIDLAILGSEGAGGAIIVTLVKGGRARRAKGVITVGREGYQLPTKFYSPKYGVNVPMDLAKQDNRITLHWEPEFEVSEQGSTLLYWSNDVPSTYRVVVEGLTETGIPFSNTATFLVQK